MLTRIRRHRRQHASTWPAVVWALALATGPHSVLAQSAEVAYVRAEMKKLRIPGLALAVVKDGVIVKSAAFGFASLELQVPAVPSTVFQIASVSKSIAGAAVMLLIEAGKLKASDSVTKLLPGLPPHWSPVTVRHLLTHTSGLPDVLARPGFGPLLFKTRKGALDSLPHLTLAGAPGDRWMYNQTNYLLLQDLVERLSGQPYVQFVQDRIFDRLGMTASGFDARAVVKGYATHYGVGEQGKLERRINDVGTVPFMYTAAGVNTSVVDLARFAEALRRKELLGARAVEEMGTPVRLNDGTNKIAAGPIEFGYGYGFVVDSRPGHRSVGHSGGGNAAFRIFLDDQLTVVVLHNGQSPNPDGLLFGIAAKYVPALTFPGGP